MCIFYFLPCFKYFSHFIYLLGDKLFNIKKRFVRRNLSILNLTQR